MAEINKSINNTTKTMPNFYKQSNGHKFKKKQENLHKFKKKTPKLLHISKKSSTFAGRNMNKHIHLIKIYCL